MKIRMSPVVLAMLPALALAQPPATRLQPGLWRFHYRTEVYMPSRSIPPQASTVQRCIANTDPQKLPLLPKLPGNIRCTPPQLQTSASNYHVTMSCTASEAGGMVSKMDEDFVITPGPHGDSMRFSGTVHQRITGMPVAIPPVTSHIRADGRRVGPCSAAAAAASAH